MAQIGRWSMHIMCIYTHLLVLVSKRVRLFDFWFCRSHTLQIWSHHSFYDFLPESAENIHNKAWDHPGIIRQVAAMRYAHAGYLIWRWVKTYTSCLRWPRPISTHSSVYHDTVVSAQDLVTNSSSKIHEYIYISYIKINGFWLHNVSWVNLPCRML